MYTINRTTIKNILSVHKAVILYIVHVMRKILEQIVKIGNNKTECFYNNMLDYNATCTCNYMHTCTCTHAHVHVITCACVHVITCTHVYM